MSRDRRCLRVPLESAVTPGCRCWMTYNHFKLPLSSLRSFPLSPPSFLLSLFPVFSDQSLFFNSFPQFTLISTDVGSFCEKNCCGMWARTAAFTKQKDDQIKLWTSGLWTPGVNFLFFALKVIGGPIQNQTLTTCRLLNVEVCSSFLHREVMDCTVTPFHKEKENIQAITASAPAPSQHRAHS